MQACEHDRIQGWEDCPACDLAKAILLLRTVERVIGEMRAESLAGKYGTSPAAGDYVDHWADRLEEAIRSTALLYRYPETR